MEKEIILFNDENLILERINYLQGEYSDIN